MKLDPKVIKAAVLERLPGGDDKNLSLQAAAVIDCLCEAINRAKPVGSATETRKLTDGWCAAFRAAHGRDYTGFRVNGAKDGQAAKRLLATGLTPEDVLEVARRAWAHPEWFNCKQAATLAGFACRFEDIRAELANPPAPKFNGHSYSNHSRASGPQIAW